MSASRPDDEVPAFALRALTRFSGERYTAHKQMLTFMGSNFRIYGPAHNLRFFVKQKAFRLRDLLIVYSDESMARPVLTIKARNLIDFSGIYDILTPQGEHIGAIKRKGLSSLFRDRWLIMDRHDAQIGLIEEDTARLALLRRMLLHLIPQRFNVTVHGKRVAIFRQHLNPFVARYDIDFSPDRQQLLDRRMGIASVVLLLAIQNSRG